MNYIYAIKDELSGFASPFVMDSDDLAKRDFMLVVRDPACNIGKSPDDYSLYRIGVYHADTGTISPESSPVKIVGARACLEVQ